MSITPDYAAALEAARKEYLQTEQKRLSALMRQVMGEVGSLRDQVERKEYELSQLRARLEGAEARYARLDAGDFTVLRELEPKAQKEKAPDSI